MDKKIYKFSEHIDYFIIDEKFLDIEELLEHIKDVGEYLTRKIPFAYWDFRIDDIIKENNQYYIRIVFGSYRKEGE